MKNDQNRKLENISVETPALSPNFLQNFVSEWLENNAGFLVCPSSRNMASMFSGLPTFGKHG